MEALHRSFIRGTKPGKVRVTGADGRSRGSRTQGQGGFPMDGWIQTPSTHPRLFAPSKLGPLGAPALGLDQPPDRAMLPAIARIYHDWPIGDKGAVLTRTPGFPDW